MMSHPCSKFEGEYEYKKVQYYNVILFRFPTIFWVPKNDKENPVPYQGGREVNEFIKFIAEHATEPLKSYDRDGKKKKKAKADEL
jgi:hypothetical protein